LRQAEKKRLKQKLLQQLEQGGPPLTDAERQRLNALKATKP
jgi:hypothetical protein